LAQFVLQIGPVDFVELTYGRINVFAKLKCFQFVTLVYDLLQAVTLKLATLVQLQTLQVIAHIGQLLKHAVRVVHIVQQEYLQTLEHVHTLTYNVRIDTLQAEHLETELVGLDELLDEFDHFNFDYVVGRVCDTLQSSRFHVTHILQIQMSQFIRWQTRDALVDKVVEWGSDLQIFKVDHQALNVHTMFEQSL